MVRKAETLALQRGVPAGFGKMAAIRKGLLLNSAELRLVTLHLLSQHPSHGYEIIKSVGDLTSGAYAPSPGMVYPVLTRIEKLSYAISEREGEKKRFRITRTGTEFLDLNRELLNEVLSRIDFLGRKMAEMQKRFAQDQMADERWGVTGKDNLAFQDLRHAFRTALFEKLNAPPAEKARVIKILQEAIDKIRAK